jgi:hypothetical protein
MNIILTQAPGMVKGFSSCVSTRHLHNRVHKLFNLPCRLGTPANYLTKEINFGVLLPCYLAPAWKSNFQAGHQRQQVLPANSPKVARGCINVLMDLSTLTLQVGTCPLPDILGQTKC